VGVWNEVPYPTFWIYSEDGVTPGQEPAVTHIFNQVTPPDPIAVSAGEQDHSDPWRYAGDDAAPPEAP